jgi:hypothetical protein
VAKCKGEIHSNGAEDLCYAYIPEAANRTVTVDITSKGEALTVTNTAYASDFTVVPFTKQFDITAVETRTIVEQTVETSLAFITEHSLETITQTSVDYETVYSLVVETSIEAVTQHSVDYVTETTLDVVPTTTVDFVTEAPVQTILDSVTETTYVKTITTYAPLSQGTTAKAKRTATPNFLKKYDKDVVEEACNCLVTTKACSVTGMYAPTLFSASSLIPLAVTRINYIYASTVTSTTTLHTSAASSVQYNVTNVHNATAYDTLQVTTTKLLTSTTLLASTYTTLELETSTIALPSTSTFASTYTTLDLETSTTVIHETSVSTDFLTSTTTLSTSTTRTTTTFIEEATQTNTVPHPCDDTPSWRTNLSAAGVWNNPSGYTFTNGLNARDCCISCYSSSQCNMWFVNIGPSGTGNCVKVLALAGLAGTSSETCPVGTPNIVFLPAGYTTPYVGGSGQCGGTIISAY